MIRFAWMILPSVLLSFCALPSQAADPKPIVVEITPKAIESPVLKYRFLPREDELKAGNAVPILLRLPWEQQNWIQKVYPNLHKWDEVPLTDPKWKDFSDLPERFFEDMKRAAYRRDAQWEYPIGEVPAMFILLPDLQGLRTYLGYGLSAKAKYHLSKGQIDETIDVIKVGLTNGRHIASTPFVINQLVAAAIERTMLDRAVDLIGHPKSPNLYWALSSIPKSILSIDRTADLEGNMLAMTFPFLNDLERPRTDEEWKKVLDQQLNYLESSVGLIVPKGEANKKKAFAGAEKVARRDLPALLGISPEKVKKMTTEEALIRWFAVNHARLDSRFSAYVGLPAREALPQLIKLNQDSYEFYNNFNGKFYDFFKNPLFNYMTLHSIYRKIQTIRIVEAVRHYAAGHEGKFPEKLDDITDLPIPLDCFTDKPFVWEVEGNMATLTAPELPEEVMASLKEQKKDSLIDLLTATYQLKLRAAK